MFGKCIRRYDFKIVLYHCLFLNDSLLTTHTILPALALTLTLLIVLTFKYIYKSSVFIILSIFIN